MQLQSRGMEFALEMIINATMHCLRITEVPTTLSPDRGDRAPHLRRHADAWRSMRLYLLMSPRRFLGIPRLMLVLLIVGNIVSIGFCPVRFRLAQSPSAIARCYTRLQPF